ncbi:hypothetical protein [Micrococcoides hystricis]|uniref:Uncharacterized protein n=1 Tax=Micrococcoides hystricis TaxID=1572761 RepID=A0ABV6PCN1_9MICC
MSRDFQRTEDGEAVVGRDQDGQVQLLVHLDPETVGELLKAHRFGQLENYVLQSC